MLALYILLGLVLLLLVLLLIPVRLRLLLEQEMEVSFSYLFFRFRPLEHKVSRTEKKEKIRKAEKQQGKEKGLFGRTLREKGLSEAFRLATQLIHSIAERFLPLLRRVVIERLDLEITVAASDAAETAIEYGGVCAAVFPLRGFLGGVMSFLEERLVVTPDFSGEESRIQLQLCARIRPFFIVGAAVRFFCALLIYKWKNRKSEDRSKVKDGASI